MRYPASEKFEIIRTVEASHLPTRQTLKMLGIPSSTYYDWYARWSDGGLDGLADRSPKPASVWNRIPDTVRDDVVDFALEHEDLTPRELAVKYTDEKRYFVSESSVYRILSAEDLITAPAHVVIRAADEFRDKTVRPNELWQNTSQENMHEGLHVRIVDDAIWQLVQTMGPRSACREKRPPFGNLLNDNVCAMGWSAASARLPCLRRISRCRSLKVVSRHILYSAPFAIFPICRWIGCGSARFLLPSAPWLASSSSRPCKKMPRRDIPTNGFDIAEISDHS
ncbi:MAG: helix-turn-helix domain-containing protein [Rhodobacteraceae bacterium]|nr:helix-turn-helix domain-containing protein [Paracoccaceae bacterium]